MLTFLHYRGMPWYKLKWEKVYRVTSLEIWTSSNPYFRYQMKNFKVVFLKKGEEVHKYDHDGIPPPTSVTITAGLPRDVDEIKIGEDWQDALNHAVSTCEVFVPLVTPRYGETQWTNRDISTSK